MTNETKPNKQDILSAAHDVFKAHNATHVATAGGPLSPWILGVYFATQGEQIVFFLETAGKSLANVRANPRVALSFSENDAMKDFVQLYGSAEILPDSEEPNVRQLLEAKMPWFKTYTPVTPVRVRPHQILVSSFSRGWFPAQKVEF